MKKDILSPIEKVALSGYLLTNDIDSSYECVNHDSNAMPDIRHRMALRWLRSEKCKNYLDDQRAILQNKAISTVTDDNDLTDRSNLLRELQVQYRAASTPKEKSDILSRIADIQQMKKLQDAKEQEQLVHFYLPRPECEGCPFSSKGKEKDE